MAALKEEKKIHRTRFSADQDNKSLKSASYTNFIKESVFTLEPLETLVEMQKLSVSDLHDEKASNEIIQIVENLSKEIIHNVEIIDISSIQLSEDESCEEEREIISPHSDKIYINNSKVVDVNADNFFDQINSFIRNENKYTIMAEEESEKSIQDAEDETELLKLNQQADIIEEESLSYLKPVLSEDDDLLIYLTEEKSEIANGSRVSIDTEGLLKDIEKKIIRTVHMPDPEEEQKQLIKETIEFLDELITNAVHKGKYIEPIHCKINKNQLMDVLIEKLKELKFERKTHVFVTNRVIDHHRRKNKLRPLAKDDPTTIDDYMQRYNVTLERLDMALGLEKDLKEKSEKAIQAIEEKLKMAKEKDHAKLKELEKIFVETFKNRGEHLEMVVELQLKGMNKMRDEISAVRNELMQLQHKNLVLSEKLRKLVEFGEHYNLQQYEYLQNEIETLVKKIEGRNFELAKARYNFNSTIHKRAYIKEQQIIKERQMNIKKLGLAKKLEEERLIRGNCVYQRKKLKRIREEVKELRFQSGLLEKPALMWEYDETVKRIENVSKRVTSLREKHDEIIRKIAYFEKQCKDTYVK